MGAIAAARARWARLREGFLFAPAVIAVCFAALAVGLTRLEEARGAGGFGIGFGGDGSAARTLLSTIAGSLITVAGLTFSITVISLQLVSQQLTPRALRNFLGDRVTQFVAGAFVGIFAYCLLVLRTVRDANEGPGFIPSFSITLAIVFGIAALALLLIFIHHTTRTIQASEITAAIARSTLRSLDELYPEPYAEPAAAADPEAVVRAWARQQPDAVLYAPKPGYVEIVAVDEVTEELAMHGGARMHVHVCPGDFVTPATPLATVWGAGDGKRVRHLIESSVVIAGERDLAHDAAFGVRQLADIAIRALSPSLNDPTTAVTCIGYLQAILERLSARDWPAAVRCVQGEPRLVLRRRSFAEHVQVAVTEVGRHAAADTRAALALLDAADAVAGAAARAGAHARVATVLDAAEAVAEQAVTAAPGAAAEEALRRQADRLRVHEALTAA